MMVELSNWTKLLIVAASAAAVAVTIVLVICIVSPFCFLHRLLPSKARLKYDDISKPKGKSRQTQVAEPVELTKLSSTPYYEYGNSMSPFIPECKSPPPTMVYGHKRLHTTDSTYSSLTPTTETGSRANSPTSQANEEETSSVGSPSVPSTDSICSYGMLTVSLQYNLKEDSTIGRLIIVLKEARDLPGREYHPTACDPFIKIALLKACTKLRRSKSHYMTLNEFQSRTLRKTKSPGFHQLFSLELPKSELKDCALKFTAFDRDKYANSTALGEVMAPLQDCMLKDAIDPVSLALEFQEPTQNNGELLLGLNYMPTSERLSFSIVKAVNLKYENVATNIDSLNLEVRILLLHNGKALKKKKTPPVSCTNNPSFNHAISFDVPMSELHHVIFLIIVAHREEHASESDDCSLDKGSRLERYIGKIAMGSALKNFASQHWHAMLNSPREQITNWHVLR